MGFNVVLGRALRQQRMQAGFLQEYVAEKVGVSVYTISRIETGKHRPSEKVLRRLCVLYGVDYASFMVAVYSQVEVVHENKTK